MRRLDIRLFVMIHSAVLGLHASAFAAETGCFTQLVPRHPGPGGRMATSHLKLSGTARGGELVLLEMINPNPRYIRLETEPGESAEMVMNRLANVLNEFTPFHPHRERIRYRNEQGQEMMGVPPKRAQGAVLKRFGGDPGGHIFAGTEIGLGIPQPPTSLSASYDPARKVVTLTWENPEQGYDAVKSELGMVPSTVATVTSESAPPQKREVPPFIIDRDAIRSNQGFRRFSVIGCLNGVLSNAGVMNLNYEGGWQEELDIHPFTAGVMPNWSRWVHGDAGEMLVLEQGTKGEWKQFEENPKAPLSPDDKPYYQLIKTHSPAAVGGVCRKFLGLKPGHTYRLWTRMNTFEMDQAPGPWSFSFHAVPHARSVTLTAAQMAGAAALPDGRSGPLVGQVAAYGPGTTTHGKFVERSTEKPEPDTMTLDITLPPDADTITVWFRCTGAIPTGVGFDWIKLKDLTGT